MKALIIGYGRAGKRHANLLDDLNIEVSVHDPYVHSDRKNVGLSAARNFDFAVICSPPDTHLDYIRLCTAYGVPILCEKPLCGLGQLEQAERLSKKLPVMMAFNYRFHPTWISLKKELDEIDMDNPSWVFLSAQNRDMPEWGITLENLPHTFDKLIWFTGLQPTITYVKRLHNDSVIIVNGKIGNGAFVIWDAIDSENKYLTGILTPFGWVERDKNQDWEMFLNMYRYFLSCLKKREKFTPGLQDGIIVQRCLEAVENL